MHMHFICEMMVVSSFSVALILLFGFGLAFCARDDVPSYCADGEGDAKKERASTFAKIEC